MENAKGRLTAPGGPGPSATRDATRGGRCCERLVLRVVCLQEPAALLAVEHSARLHKS
jgi:hypothetical protein